MSRSDCFCFFKSLEKGGDAMPYFSQSQITEARQLDLLTYLRLYEPNELVHVSGNIYSTRTHDSLKISNGKWMWWSKKLLFSDESIRGERPVKDLKYNILKHPNVVLTADGRAGMYKHGLEAVAKNTITLSPEILPAAIISQAPDDDYLLMSEEDVIKEYL